MTNLKKRIMDSGQPMYKIAALIGISPPRVSEACHGKSMLSPGRLLTLADYLGCHPSDLLGDYDESQDLIQPLFFSN